LKRGVFVQIVQLKRRRYATPCYVPMAREYAIIRIAYRHLPPAGVPIA